MYNLPLAIVNLGIPELSLILIVVLLLFGASRLPALARSIGESMKELKKARLEGESEKEEDVPEKS